MVLNFFEPVHKIDLHQVIKLKLIVLIDAFAYCMPLINKGIVKSISRHIIKNDWHIKIIHKFIVFWACVAGIGVLYFPVAEKFRQLDYA